MDVNRGRLVADLNSLPEEERRKFIPVPEHLQADASALLAGGQSATVDMRKRNPVVDWARSERKRQKNRARNKAAKRSRAANR